MRVFFTRSSLRDSARGACPGCRRDCDDEAIGDNGRDKDFLLELQLSFLCWRFPSACLLKIRAHLRAASRPIEIRKSLDIAGSTGIRLQNVVVHRPLESPFS